MPSRKIRALLVDDHVNVRQAIRQLLERSDEIEIVGELGDGEQALELVETLRPDVIILDVNMPGIDGFMILTRLNQLPFRPHVVMLSMYDSETLRKKALRYGASAYVSKRMAHLQLLQTLRSVVCQ